MFNDLNENLFDMLHIKRVDVDNVHINKLLKYNTINLYEMDKLYLTVWAL